MAESQTARQIFWRDVAIAGLVLSLAVAVLTLATWGFPAQQNILYPITGSLTGAAMGLFSAALAQKRTAQYFFDALRMSKIKNANIGELRPEYARYRFLYWKTVKIRKDGTLGESSWSVTDVQWQQFGDLPFFTGISDVSDIDEDDPPRPPDSPRRRYEHLMFLTRGRFVLLTTQEGSNEPTAVHVFWHPTSGDTLIGHLRHVTWAGEEALSPCILSERPHHEGRRVTPPRQSGLDAIWVRLKADRIQDNLPQLPS